MGIRSGFSFVKGEHHPENKAWDKCCGTKEDCQCAFRRYPPDAWETFKGRSRYIYNHLIIGFVENREVPFFCCHRLDDDGFQRICAGWNAVYGEKKNG